MPNPDNSMLDSESQATIVVAALYRFVRLDDFVDLREPLLAEMRRLGVRGSLLLAHEGINGTVAGEREAVDGLLAYLRATSGSQLWMSKNLAAPKCRSDDHSFA